MNGRLQLGRLAWVVLFALLAGCGDDDDDGNVLEPGPRAGSISLLAGNNQVVGIGIAVPVAPAVIVRDENGRPFAGTIVTFTIEAGNGAVTDSVDTTGTDGIARVGSWTLGPTPGVNRLLASNPEVFGSPVRFTAVATPQVATTLFVLEGNNQVAPAGSAVPIAPAVVVVDQDRQAFTGAIVTFSVLSGGGEVAGAVDTTGPDGIAQVGSWTLGAAPDTNELRVSALGVDSALVFTATGILVATTIAVFEGDAQTAEAGTAVAIAPAVIVRDQNGAPFAGTAVTFAVESGGGTIAGATDTTDSAGVARVGSWTLGATAGENALLATASGISGSPVRFTATATATAAAPRARAVRSGRDFRKDRAQEAAEAVGSAARRVEDFRMRQRRRAESGGEIRDAREPEHTHSE